MLTHVWIIPAVMATSFALILLFGRRLPERITSGIGIAAVGICFVLSLIAGVQWIQRVNSPPGNPASAVAATNTQPGPGHEPVRTISPKASSEAPSKAEAVSGGAEATASEEETPTSPVVERITWFQTDGVRFELGTLADGLSVMMLITVTLISLLVHIYSTEYLHGDRRFTHYYAFLSLFTAAMLFYVISLEHAPDADRLGARRRLFVRADRALVGGEAQHRRVAQGLPHQPRRRRRAHDRRDPHVLRRRCLELRRPRTSTRRRSRAA